MERRAILAAVLMAALLIIYQTLFLTPGEPPHSKGAPTTMVFPAMATDRPKASPNSVLDSFR